MTEQEVRRIILDELHQVANKIRYYGTVNTPEEDAVKLAAERIMQAVRERRGELST